MVAVSPRTCLSSLVLRFCDWNFIISYYSILILNWTSSIFHQLLPLQPNSFSCFHPSTNNFSFKLNSGGICAFANTLEFVLSHFNHSGPTQNEWHNPLAVLWYEVGHLAVKKPSLSSPQPNQNKHGIPGVRTWSCRYQICFVKICVLIFERGT